MFLCTQPAAGKGLGSARVRRAADGMVSMGIAGLVDAEGVAMHLKDGGVKMEAGAEPGAG